MKKSLLLIAVMLISFATANAQSCLPEGIIFSTQEQIDNFQSDYPGCTEIEGNVRIQGAGITNLNGLSVLTAIGGSLQIRLNSALTSLNGLEGLTSIGGSLRIRYNYSLTSLTGLDNLTFVGSSLTLNNNTTLSACNTDWLCNVLEIVSGSVTIQGNAPGCLSLVEVALSCGGMACLPNGIYNFILQSDIDNFSVAFPGCINTGSIKVSGDDINNLNGLNVLTSINGTLEIHDIHTLPNLNGLNNITYIGGRISIKNSSLINMTGLEGLHSVGSDFFIGANPSLISLSGLENLLSIGRHLTIGNQWAGGNPALTNLDGLDNLASIGGGMDLCDNPLLNNLSGLNSLTSIGGGFFVVGNSSLTSFTGLSNLKSLGSDLMIISNSSLYDLQRLEGLTYIHGEFTLKNNNSLTSLVGLDNITTFGSGVKIGSINNGNQSLASLAGLEKLTSIGSSLTISSNPHLNNMSGLENLTSIGWALWIRDNSSLTNIVHLRNLKSLGDILYISGNPLLTSLSGLDSINAGSITNLTIWYNSSLSTCHIQSICDYLVDPNGTVDISNNAPGCNSVTEVIEACIVTVEEISPPQSFSIFPNPANDRLTVQLMLENPEPVRITLLNAAGQRMALIADEQPKAGEYGTEIDISTWPVGVYLCKVQAGQETRIQKIIKVQ